MSNGTSKISNPLTLIAVFAGVSEAMGLGILPFVKDLSVEAQNVLVTFLVAFPTSLVAMFFVTLYIQPHLLYGPGDWQDEQNFMDLLTQKFQTKFSAPSMPTQEADGETKKEFTASESERILWNFIGAPGEDGVKNAMALEHWLTQNEIEMEAAEFTLSSTEEERLRVIKEMKLEGYK
jgi:hypothetical protein